MDPRGRDDVSEPTADELQAIREAYTQGCPCQYAHLPKPLPCQHDVLRLLDDLDAARRALAEARETARNYAYNLDQFRHDLQVRDAWIEALEQLMIDMDQKAQRCSSCRDEKNVSRAPEPPRG